MPAVVLLVPKRPRRRLVDDDVVEAHAPHRRRLIRQQHPGALLRAEDGDVAQRDVGVLPARRRVAVRARHSRPADGARAAVRRAEVCQAASVALLRRPDPDGELLRLLNHDVLVEDVADRAGAAELHVDALDRANHARVPKGDIADVGGDGANGKAKAACVDVLDDDVVGAVLDVEAVVLVPHLAVMDPDGVAMSEVEPVSVEGGQVEQIMTVGVRPSVVDARVPHLEVRHAASEEGPVGRLAEVQPLHQNVVRLQHGEQPRPILLPAHSSSARVNGVSSQLQP
mmetsp:Transcript_47135/g.152214  ORF Transcript_47135/g.152214 Transcript_47135/m.152214 type:complete len:284 (-) Transcript_47135:352-1203(-)